MSGCDPIWERIFSSETWGKYPPEHVIRFVARHFYRVPERSQTRLLDLGSGPGASTWYMAREGFQVSAIDGSPSAIEHLLTRLREEGLSVDAAVGDFARLPWPDRCFDAVIDNCSIYANREDHARAVFAEVLRVLAPGGTFFSTWFSDRTWGYGLGPRVERSGFSHVTEGPLKARGFVRFVGRSELDEMFAAFGSYTVERSSYTLALGQLVEHWHVTATKASS